MPIAVAAPYIYSAVAAYAGSKLANRGQGSTAAASSAKDPAAAEARLADTLAQYSRDQYQLSRPAYQQALGLYSTLAGGSRSAIRTAIAPQVQTINEQYRGAQKYLDQQGVRGGERDQAVADLSRQRTGMLGTLPMQARMEALDKLGGLGAQGTTGALGAMGGAGGLYGQLAGFQQQDKQARNQMWGQIGSAAGQIALWYLMNRK